ncbi:MAG TPA: DUF6644 family protein [Noviherbaspirillum sp.]|jgi:hypothetical protein|uniref:DUF6644 family protein n=1 Tax=Noviherbaspirillum sp. TaxID=1926288 RepID=UPI002DDD5D84|nr:DUF6644 family protein [Noviherbaspirillum sp.]HEV2608718.1 DUF6644 family protein [Noviherbaspirillum sp.]
MHETAGIFGWLAASGLGQAMRGWLWLYPIVEIVHIVGFVVLVGAVAMFDLRILGFARQLPVPALGGHLLRWSAAGLILIIPAGLMMFSAHPDEFAASTVFRLKLALIAAAGLNAAIFHMGVYRSAATWGQNAAIPASAKVQALLSLLLWIAVISCGRLLAYT